MRGLRDLLLLVTAASAAVYPTRFNQTTWDDNNWRITTTQLLQGNYETRMGLANGYLGIALASVGPFFEVDNQSMPQQAINFWPLYDRRQSFATVAGFYGLQPKLNGTNYPWLDQYGWNTAISGIPHWSGLHVQVGQDVLAAGVPEDQISGFTSVLDIGTGSMSWRYTWSPPTGPAIDVEYSMFVHKLYVNQAAVRVKLTASKSVNATVIDVMNGDAAVRTDFADKAYEDSSPTIWSGVRPSYINNVTAYIYSTLHADDPILRTRKQFEMSSVIGGNSSSIAQAVDLNLTPGCTVVVTKYIGGASTDAFRDPQVTARNASLHAASLGYESMLESHIKEWESILTPESVDNYRDPSTNAFPEDENVQELQITAITNPFQLLQNTVGTNAIEAAGNNTKLDVNSISVCGLAGSCYAGFIFWDADVWMQPGLVVSHPQAAKQIAQYRVEKFPDAKGNILRANESSQNQTGKFSSDGANYAWTEGRYANATATGPAWDYEYHLNGDIGLDFYHYYSVTGDNDYFNQSLLPIYDAIAQMFADLVTYNATTGMYELYNATDPDEYANNEDNVGFTMVLMKTHIDTANEMRQRFGLEPNMTWANISSLITVPVNKDANIILEYQTMNNSVSVKQADIVLIDDFLDYPNPYTLSDLDYYAAKQSLSGPAMTYGAFSIVANRFSPSGCSSYTYDLYGSQPYTRAPWFQFSENLIEEYSLDAQTNFAFPFLTGIGGAHRVSIFGYLGLRLNPSTLNIDPSLPPQLSHLKYRNIYWQGHEISASSNQTHTTLIRTGHSLPNANTTFLTAPIPVTIGLTPPKNQTFSLPLNGTLTFLNRQIGNIQSIPGNIAQCRAVSSPSSFAVGQFPLAAIDGAVSTKWQPSYANTSSSLTVSLSEPFVPISEIRFDWAQAPPHSFEVFFSNSSAERGTSVVMNGNVSVSEPYDARTADVLGPYASNTTNVTVGKDGAVWSGRYATLVVEGSRANDGTADERNGTGCTVAEFALIRAS